MNMYLYGCSMCYGVNAVGLENSVEYINIKNKLEAKKGYFNGNLIDIVKCCRMPGEFNSKLKNLNSVLATCEIIAQKANEIIMNNEVSLFIAGDHSSAIGSVSASSNNYDDLGLIWLDAHPDINTDETTITGNIHGMSVAALLGIGETKLTKILNEKVKIKPENIVMLGLRDIDPPEQNFLNKLNIRYYNYYDMEKKGIKQCLDETRRYLGKRNVHVSIDLDCMDPKIIPGVSVPVNDGFITAEMDFIVSYIKNNLNVIAWDIVEFNQKYDVNDVTADYLLKLINQICMPLQTIENVS